MRLPDIAAMFLQLVTLAALTQTAVFAIDDQSILEDGATGTPVVLLTLARIEESSIFPNDNGIFRRIAYVETRDGTRDNENIWAVSEGALQLTQNADDPILNVKHNLIAQELGIDWTVVEFDDLRRPLYSALAARLLLFLAPEMIPDSNDIEGQAQFWQQYYNTGGSIEEFTGAANELEGIIMSAYIE